MSDRMFSELDQVFQDILDGVSPAGRTRTARKIGLAVRRSQQRRIASQKNPDGSGYAVRRRKVYRTQQGIKFFWNNEVRALKNWRGGRGKYGRTITGFDEKRRDIRTFYRADIERKSTRLNSSHLRSSYAVFCLKKKALSSANVT